MAERVNTRDLQNLNYATKKQIIKSLEEQGDQDACCSLIEFLYDDHKPIKRLAMASLIRIGTAEVMGCVLPLLHENDAMVRTMAMEVIREIAYDRISLLIPLLEDSHESMRISIADLLGLIGNPEAVEPLIASLQDTSPQVRSSALASLGKLADVRAVEAIENLLRTENESWVVFSCVKTLERIGGEKAIQILLDLLKQEDEFILASAIESLGEIGNREIITPILNTISQPGASIIERMNRAFISILQRDEDANLSKTNERLSKQSRDSLISFFNSCAGSDIDIRTRSRAIELLGELKAKECLDTLARVVQNGPPSLQSAAARTLGNIGGDTARSLLMHLSASPDSITRTVARESLRKLA